MSFQKAHNVSNELAEVLVTSGVQQLDNMDATIDLAPQPAASGKRYRVLEIGYTVEAYSLVGGTTGHANCFEIGIKSDAGGTARPAAFLDNVPVPASAGSGGSTAVDAAVFVQGFTASTSRGGAETLSFVPVGTVGASVDADGVPFLEPGQVIRITRNNNLANAQLDVVFFARLAPVVGHDIFA
tara:strand:- start:765 stop:1316 length:552 start_codon:yes stop_codon:yes gene_type:complete